MKSVFRKERYMAVILWINSLGIFRVRMHNLAFYLLFFRTVFSTFTKNSAIEISFVTFTLHGPCMFSTLTVNEFIRIITYFLSLCQICPKRFSI